ncbi:hypothetical protein SDC9_55110 [bioreactor metagenome]|uniref:Uncharacterized protein n=1 Tax=bioreactor metagenome TaxID=1076179 RepID=A0A644X3S8_9ZZZZ
MYVSFFEHCIIYVEFFCIRLDIAQRSHGRFLHYIAQLTCKLKFSVSLHGVDFNKQSLSAGLSPCKPCYNTHLVFLICQIIVILWYSKIIFKVQIVNSNCLFLFLCNLYSRFSHKFSYISFQISNSGFPCVSFNNFIYCIFRNFHLFFLEPVF